MNRNGVFFTIPVILSLIGIALAGLVLYILAYNVLDFLRDNLLWILLAGTAYFLLIKMELWTKVTTIISKIL